MLNFAVVPQEDNKLNGDSSLEGSLVKDKFGNTLNLINVSDTSLHKTPYEVTPQSDR